MPQERARDSLQMRQVHPRRKHTGLKQRWEMLRMDPLGQHPLDQSRVKLMSRPNNWNMGDKRDLVDRT